MTCMSDDTFSAVLHDLYGLFPADHSLPLKTSHKKVGHVAHGWFMRAKRSCQALEAMRESGFATEAWPIRRAILEHALALRWLAEQGNGAQDVIVRSHGEAARRRQEAASSAGWASAEWPVWTEVRSDADAATGNTSESNILTNMKVRCYTYGSADDFARWLIESNNSHPSWETARPYMTPPPVSLLTEPDFDADFNDDEFCATRLLRCLASIADMLAQEPWRLGEFAARVTSLQAANASMEES